LTKEEAQMLPEGPISPKINGLVDSYFEWLGAGVYKVDQRSGSMHGKRALVREVRYGASDSRLYLRIDFAEEAANLEGLEVHAEVPGTNGEPERKLKIKIAAGAAAVEGTGAAAFDEVMEIALVSQEEAGRVRLSFWQDGVPVLAIPPQDYLRISNPVGWQR
jgi:hypothetical protein